MNGEDTNLAIFQTLQNIQRDVSMLSGEVRANIVNLKEDVQKLDRRIDDGENKQWWHSGIILPLNVLVHVVIRKLGGNI